MNWSRFFQRPNKEHHALHSTLKLLLGFKPRNIHLYRLALKHSSKAKQGNRLESYERLEYLGDAILGAIVAEHLFRMFPKKKEGFLTEVRSRIVNRENLNKLGKKIGLKELINYQRSGPADHAHKSLVGDVLEAIVGAIYLDQGYKRTSHFVIHQLIGNHVDIDKIKTTTSNFKSVIVEWAQKNNCEVEWVLLQARGKSHHRLFESALMVDGELYSKGKGYSKKKSEQAAAQQACLKLNLLED